MQIRNGKRLYYILSIIFNPIFFSYWQTLFKHSSYWQGLFILIKFFMLTNFILILFILTNFIQTFFILTRFIYTDKVYSYLPCLIIKAEFCVRNAVMNLISTQYLKWKLAQYWKLIDTDLNGQVKVIWFLFTFLTMAMSL